jgi:hypothetical protein
MKKYFLIQMLIIWGVSYCCCAQQIKSSSQNSEQQQRNIAADNVLLEAFETGDVGKLDGIISPDFFNHTGNHKGIDTLKNSIKAFHEHMKTVKVDLIRQLADDEFVADWVRYTGANTAMVIEGMEVTRYKGGRAVEHWFFSYNQPSRK